VKFTRTHKSASTCIEVNGETAHSLYTTNDRGVNEVGPRYPDAASCAAVHMTCS
jgi:hypothetical protein